MFYKLQLLGVKNKMILFLLLFFSNQVFASVLPDDIIGLWENGSGKGHIQIYKEGNKYYGKIIWLTNNTDAMAIPKLIVKIRMPYSVVGRL
jgi:hypothetical protein